MTDPAGSFAAASRFERIGAGEHRGAIDAAWAQGPGACGGLVAAILARATIADAPEGHALATLHATFCAPATEGHARVRTEIVRAGRNVSTMRATMERDGAVLATSLATLCRPRRAPLEHHALVAPDVPPPEQVRDGPEAHYIPAFARRFSFRQCLGSPPFEGAPAMADAHIGGWCRLEEDVDAIDAPLLAMLLDSWPPAAVAVAPEWCPVASLELTYHFLAPRPIPTADPRPFLLYDARCRELAGGLADETAVIYDRAGAPLATSRQLIVIFDQSAPRRS